MIAANNFGFVVHMCRDELTKLTFLNAENAPAWKLPDSIQVAIPESNKEK